MVWGKMKPPHGPRVLVQVAICQGKPIWGYPILDPQPPGNEFYQRTRWWIITIVVPDAALVDVF